MGSLEAQAETQVLIIRTWLTKMLTWEKDCAGKGIEEKMGLVSQWSQMKFSSARSHGKVEHKLHYKISSIQSNKASLLEHLYHSVIVGSPWYNRDKFYIREFGHEQSFQKIQQFLPAVIYDIQNICNLVKLHTDLVNMMFLLHRQCLLESLLCSSTWLSN